MFFFFQLLKLRERLDGVSSDLPKLQRGYVAVSNRDTQVTVDGSSVQGEDGDGLTAASRSESAWFDKHLPGYRTDKGLASIGALLSKLNDLMHG